MELRPIKVTNTCVADDETLTRHVHLALARGLPVVGQHFQHDMIAVLVGSGPSLSTQLAAIQRQRERGWPIVAIKDAHDWLIEHDLVPDYAVALDPTERQWQCFRRKHPSVKYFIASQCHPTMFDHLADQQVWLWHLTFNEGKAYPVGTITIGGCTTTGLRAISLLYTMGFRRFELYGYDSCLLNGQLRVDTAWKREDEANGQLLHHVKVGDCWFHCNAGMLAQADEFQRLFEMMPDIFIQSYGPGLLAAILAERAKPQMVPV